MEVVLEYTEELPAMDGAFSFRFPLTFIPRFDEAGDADGDTAGLCPSVPEASIVCGNWVNESFR